MRAQYGIVPAPFTPLPRLAPVKYDTVVEGLASPATVDREFTRFAADCWTPFASSIPFLFRHDPEQPAGRLEEVRATEQGLFVRARITHEQAKCCPYFSVAATVHSYRIIQNGAQSYGEITSATLDDVSMVYEPGNADALVRRPPPSVEIYDIAKTAFGKGIEIIEVLRRMNARVNAEINSHFPRSRAASHAIPKSCGAINSEEFITAKSSVEADWSGMQNHAREAR